MNLIPAGIILFFLSGFTTLLLPPKFKGHLFSIINIVAAGLILPKSISILSGNASLSWNLPLSAPIGNVILRLDPLAAFFTIIISIAAVLTAIYSHGYMKMYARSRYSLSTYYICLGFLVASMLLVVLVQNSLAFLIVWEVMSFSSFFLVSFEHEKPEVRRAGLYYLVAMQVGVAFLIAAFSWMYHLTGSLDFNSFASISDKSIITLIFLLFFLGFGTKAGFIPLHSWLPLAHPAAPSGVSAIMSGIMIKTGIYGILRMLIVLPQTNVYLAYFVLGISLLTGIYGIMNALVQSDLKKLLAYSSIENIGIIGMGIGLGMLGQFYQLDSLILFGYLGALLHIFNHFIFKSLLFFGAGAVYSQTHTRRMESMGGLIRLMPITSILFLLGSLAICGLPLFNGFISEFLIYRGLADGITHNPLALNLALLAGLAGLAFIGVMAIICFTKVYGICFLGSSRTKYKHQLKEVSFSLLLPMILLTSGIVIIGLGSPLLLPLLLPLLNQFLPASALPIWENMIQTMQQLSLGLGILTGIMVILLGLHGLLLRNRKVVKSSTWGCGYQGGSSKIQYTGSSFVSPFRKLICGLVPAKVVLKVPTELFPTQSSYQSENQDFLQTYLIDPLNQLVSRFLKLFSGVQSGRTQQYILYGLISLVILIIVIIGAH